MIWLYCLFAVVLLAIAWLRGSSLEFLAGLAAGLFLVGTVGNIAYHGLEADKRHAEWLEQAPKNAIGVVTRCDPETGIKWGMGFNGRQNPGILLRPDGKPMICTEDEQRKSDAFWNRKSQ